MSLTCVQTGKTSFLLTRPILSFTILMKCMADGFILVLLLFNGILTCFNCFFFHFFLLNISVEIQVKGWTLFVGNYISAMFCEIHFQRTSTSCSRTCLFV